MRNQFMKLSYVAVFMLLTQVGYSQTKDAAPAAESEQEKMAKAIQNPLANMVSVPFQDNLDFNDENTNTLNIQPVLPFKISEGVNLIWRNIIPVVSAPDYGGSRVKGIGNISSAFFFTPAKPGKLIWGVGPTFTLGSFTKDLGLDKTSVAPSAMFLYQNNGWTMGTLLQNSWSFAGPSDAPDVNLFYTQVFITKSLKKGWYVNTAPIITANWEADSSNRWTVPLGAGFGKLGKINKLPINWQIGYYQYLESASGASGQLRMQFNIYLPKLY